MSWAIDPLCPLGQALEVYRQRISILKKGYEQERYRIAHLCRTWLADVAVAQITSVMISQYRDERLQTINPRTGKRISAATVRLELSLLSNFFDIARIEWGACEANPCVNVRKPKPAAGRTRRLLPNEERILLARCNNLPTPEMSIVVIIALETAMRQGEILSLRWEHIDLRGRIAHLPQTKNGSQRDVPLSLKAREAIMRLGIKDNGRLFSYTSNGLKSSWRNITQSVGISDLHFHDLRHEAISRLFELGTMDSMEIASISGHKSMSMLKRYTHLKAQRLVKKLDPIRGKVRQLLLGYLLPYPAIEQQQGNLYIIKVPDFNITAYGLSRDEAISSTELQLLKGIISCIRDGVSVPKPGQRMQMDALPPSTFIYPLGSE